ncbi:7336_t:CDS:2 [Funneliformis geosporum]|uniref:7336_t:CDS:1 n=1 Tax=Funneliformis geosporum TaxID=1117311 RepID=A0A9W4SZG3_9GLOM|nr:7336_t:CDS:2 [Funneliformis geosporum]
MQDNLQWYSDSGNCENSSHSEGIREFKNNWKNCEDSLQSELCDMKEFKSDQYDEVIAKLDKNIIVE